MISSFLEDFGPVALVPQLQSDRDAADEDEKLAIFEEGYAAGWEDAIKAQADNTAVATEQFAKNLGDLSFTYHEARQNVAAAMVPLLSTMTTQVVPAGLEASTVALILQELEARVDEAGTVPVEIHCSAARAELLTDALPTIAVMPAKIVVNDAMGRDEVTLRFSNAESTIDLGDIAAQIQSAVDAFTYQTQKDLLNG